MGSCKFRTNCITENSKQKMRNDLEKIGNDSETTYKLKLKTLLDKFKSEHLHNKTSFTEAIRVLLTALKNITENPHEPRYRRIPCSNIRIQTKLTNLHLGTDLLLVAGFCLLDEDTSCWSFPNTNDQVALWCLQTLEEYYSAVATEDEKERVVKKTESELKPHGPITRNNATRLKKKSNDEKLKEREHLLFLLEQDRLEREAEMKYVANLQISAPKTVVTTPQNQNGKFATLTDLFSTPTEYNSLYKEKDVITKTSFTNHFGTTRNNTTIRTLYDNLPPSAESKSKTVVSDEHKQHQKALNELLSKFKEDKKYFLPQREYKISTPSTANLISSGTVINKLTPGSVVLEVTGKPVKALTGVATGNTPTVQVASVCEQNVLETVNSLENYETKNKFNRNDNDKVKEDKCSTNEKREEREKNDQDYNVETDESFISGSNNEDLTETTMDDGRSLFSKRPFLFVNSQRPCLYTLKKIHNERQNRRLKKSTLLIPEKCFEKKIVDSYETTYVSSENNTTQEKKNVVIHHSKAIISAEKMVAPYWVSKIRIRKLDTPPSLPVEPTSESS